MAVEKRATFNEVAQLYDRIRNRYPDQLFEDLTSISQLTSASRVLEIGPGTGIATLPLAQLGCCIVGVELGSEMASVARHKLAAFPNADIQIAAFEEWNPPAEPFDLVLAATAFHWLDPGVRYLKSAALLRPGGHLAIVQYRPVAGGDQSFFDRVQKCYEQYMPGTPPNLRLTPPGLPPGLPPEVAEMAGTGLFDPPTVRTYVTEETYSSEQYIRLLSTYSDHRILEPPIRHELFDCITSLINRDYGGMIRKCYQHDLVIARKSNSPHLKGNP